MAGRPLNSIELTQEQRKTLRSIVHLGASPQRLARRARIILEADGGGSNAQVAWLAGVPRTQVQFWRRRWLAAAPALIVAEDAPSEETLTTAIERVLSDASRSGAPATFSSEQVSDNLIEILHQRPDLFGINRTTWTLDSIAAAYNERHAQRISRSTVHRVLEKAGLRWTKSRRTLTSSDPDYREKVKLVLKTLQSLQDDEVFFFIDELGPMRVREFGGRSYAARHEVPTHPQNPPSRGSVTLCGALSATTNQVTWMYGEAKDTATMVDLVEVLFNQHHSKSRIYITWDAASWHRSSDLAAWLDQRNGRTRQGDGGPIIELVPLPSGAQFLNVIEAVFDGMKGAVIHNSDYESEEQMKGAVSRHFRERNAFFRDNPQRAGKKIWEIDFFEDHDNLRSGNYRGW